MQFIEDLGYNLRPRPEVVPAHSDLRKIVYKQDEVNTIHLALFFYLSFFKLSS